MNNQQPIPLSQQIGLACMESNKMLEGISLPDDRILELYAETKQKPDCDVAEKLMKEIPLPEGEFRERFSDDIVDIIAKIRCSENVLEPLLRKKSLDQLWFGGIGFFLCSALAVLKITSNGDYSYLPKLLNLILTGLDEGANFFIYLFPFPFGVYFLKHLRRYFSF